MAARPPPSALDALPNNLPAQPTTFVGRAHELVAVAERLGRSEVRLLTLTGPGGTGKTRLAIEAAGLLRGEFPDGVCFIDLAPLTDPHLVISAVARTLGIQDGGSRSLAESVRAFLQDRHALLILDNCEHLLAAAPDVAALLAACPYLKVLATSRAPLHLRWEHELTVPPLSLPDPAHLAPVAAVARVPAVALFLQRAAAVCPGFQLTETNAAAVAGICIQLDGLPLAIELAAARTKVLSPEALLARLNHRLALLTGGTRDQPARHQTLRAAIDWSYGLLAPQEQTLLRRLAVFAGGCPLEAAEVVCRARGDPPGDLLDRVASLLDHGLLRRQDGADGVRFCLLETVREYAAERLEASGEAADIRAQNAQYFLALAERAAAELRGPWQATWLRRLDEETDNLRQILAWSGGTSDPDQDQLQLRLATALGEYWQVRGRLSEGRHWLEELLAGPSSANHPPARAKALSAAGLLAIGQSDHDAAWVLHTECLAIWHALGDNSGTAGTLTRLGAIARERGDHEAARTLIEQSLALKRSMGDQQGVAEALTQLGYMARDREDFADARSRAEESLAIWREVGDDLGIARALHALAHVGRDQGDYRVARALYQESLGLFRKVGYTIGTAAALSNIGLVEREQGGHRAARRSLEQSLQLRRQMADGVEIAYTVRDLGSVALVAGDLPRATALFQESLAAFVRLRNRQGVALCLVGLTGLAAARGCWPRVARLAGTTQALYETIGSSVPPIHRASFERPVAAARERLGARAFARSLAQGRAVAWERAVDGCNQKFRVAGEAAEMAGSRDRVCRPVCRGACHPCRVYVAATPSPPGLSRRHHQRRRRRVCMPRASWRLGTWRCPPPPRCRSSAACARCWTRCGFR
jgi:non-specific serine/threonine protein kinase